ncbi:MAG TPA: hypothetical protein VEB66_14915 [Opitutaceae bacterium]|nr:hypothetical protein [Opitutaceae bacterium]
MLPALPAARPSRRPPRLRALTLVEVMVSLTLLATVMVGFISTFVQSRRTTESSVLHAAATALVYGMVEQIKALDYTTLLPSMEVDPDAPDAIEDDVPYIRVRVNQDLTVWLRCVYTPAPEDGSDPTPAAPTSTPATTVAAADIGAIDNFIGSIPLSTVTGTTSQDLSLNLWVWVDEIPNEDHDVTEVKRVTIVYTYSYLDGSVERVVRDRESFIRTRYDQ